MSTIATDSPAAIVAAVTVLKREIGVDAYIGVSLVEFGDGEPPIRVSVYPRGVVHECAFVLRVSEWAEVLPALRARWSEFAVEHHARTIRAMALEIIRITAEQGECSDAALRLKFSAEDVERLGAEACADADRIASNGPFTIARHAGANAA